MQYAYIWQDQDYVPDYKDQKSEMVRVEQVLEKCFVLLLGLKSAHYACEDGTRLSSEGSPEKMSLETSHWLLLRQVCLCLVLHKDMPKQQVWMVTKAIKFYTSAKRSWWLQWFCGLTGFFFFFLICGFKK